MFIESREIVIRQQKKPALVSGFWLSPQPVEEGEIATHDGRIDSLVGVDATPNALSVSLPECAPECITSGEATATAFSLSEGGPHG